MPRLNMSVLAVSCVCLGIGVFTVSCSVAESSRTTQSTKAQTDESPPDLSGTWESDPSYTRDFLLKGRELQLRWCGFGWPESDIDRRLEAVKGSWIRHAYRKTGPMSYAVSMLNDKGESRTKTLTECALTEDRRIKCRALLSQGRTAGLQGSEWFRLDGGYLWLDYQAHKREMQCPRASEGPDETAWISQGRMAKK